MAKRTIPQFPPRRHAAQVVELVARRPGGPTPAQWAELGERARAAGMTRRGLWDALTEMAAIATIREERGAVRQPASTAAARFIDAAERRGFDGMTPGDAARGVKLARRWRSQLDLAPPRCADCGGPVSPGAARCRPCYMAAVTSAP